MYGYLVNHNIRVTSFKYILCCSMIKLFADYCASVLPRVTTITITQLYKQFKPRERVLMIIIIS